jgi:hypothetical protein
MSNECRKNKKKMESFEYLRSKVAFCTSEKNENSIEENCYVSFNAWEFFVVLGRR